ncbi:MAG TPA: hypothetical protein VNV86_14585 [Candidatus Acidoferrum sp.]|nr:hypothetical protein [Candidatus Acidoferrum sp.]
MTLKLIHSKARELRAKTRRKVLGSLGAPVAVALCCVIPMRAFPRQGQLLPMFAGALVWSLIGLYFLNRGMWSPVMPGDAGLRTGLEFCREEIERRRNLLRRVLLWSLGPILLAIGTLVAALAMVGSKDRGLLPNGLPFLTLVVVWIIGYFVVRAREQRELEREIEELDDLERDTR